ncbi:hypothetical protein [Flavobacterium sp.]|uniref:hypothetical protein n=1 Tax=Flavobacterium sp. TaxID=239 RepID=UPI00263A2E76|nr:hypothetical protein [Flavobacterium sp.]
MKSLFKFIRNYFKAKKDIENIDRSDWKGKDFEFMITGDINIPIDKFEEIMLPKSLELKEIQRDNWTYYQFGENEFTFSDEMVGIQMSFNDSIHYILAKEIVDEVLEQIKSFGQTPELLILRSDTIYKFS